MDKTFHILYGEDDFSLKSALEGIKESLEPRELVDSNTSVLDGRDLTFGHLTSVCDTIPFLSEKRLVVVSGLLSRWERRREEHPKSAQAASRSKGLEEWRALADYVKRMPTTTVLVLVDGSLSRANPLLQQLMPLVNVQEFPILKGMELHSWIKSRVSRQGGSISDRATGRLADLIGGNLWALSGEVEKLCLYALGRRIEEKDVELLVASAREESIFALVDATMAHDLHQATRVLHKLLDEGAVAPYILAMLARQFRMLIQCKELVRGNVSLEEIKGKLGLAHEFALKKIMAQAREHSWEHLEKVYAQLLETDLSIKTGRLREELALDLLMAKLCGHE